MKIILLAILLSALLGGTVHYDDEDGHREPWAEWKESSCVISEPAIIMDTVDGYCNPHTQRSVTVWACQTGLDIPDHISHYTTHWYCKPFDIPIQGMQSLFFPLINKE